MSQDPNVREITALKAPSPTTRRRLRNVGYGGTYAFLTLLLATDKINRFWPRKKAKLVIADETPAPSNDETPSA